MIVYPLFVIIVFECNSTIIKRTIHNSMAYDMVVTYHVKIRSSSNESDPNLVKKREKIEIQYTIQQESVGSG